LENQTGAAHSVRTPNPMGLTEEDSPYQYHFADRVLPADEKKCHLIERQPGHGGYQRFDFAKPSGGPVVGRRLTVGTGQVGPRAEATVREFQHSERGVQVPL